MVAIGGPALMVLAVPVFAIAYIALLFGLPGGQRHFTQLWSIARDLVPSRWLPTFDVERRTEMGR